jgi:putative spermidine/putrescine transport system ATP-binding protein
LVAGVSTLGISVELNSLCKSYRGVKALDAVSLTIPAGSFASLLGPSGSGKTTALNLIAGFIAPDSGSVLFDGEPVSDIPPYERNIGMVFQSYALFPHLTVFDNVAFPLRMRTPLRKEALRARVSETLDLVRLSGKEGRFPRQLSGGQQQRVAMARALVSRPRLLLMDEPLGALDKALKADLQLEIKEIHRKLGSTFLYVTHDQEEALTMSNVVIVMRDGRISQIGGPVELYDNPNSAFVAAFLGDANLLPATLQSTRGESQLWTIENGTTVSLPKTTDGEPGRPVSLLIRPEDVRCYPDVKGDSMPATLEHIAFLGNTCKLTVRAGGVTLSCLAHPSATMNWVPGQTLHIAWDRARVRVLPTESPP